MRELQVPVNHLFQGIFCRKCENKVPFQDMNMNAGIPLKRTDFQGQNLLGIDYGKKRTGLATFKIGSDPYPLPYGVIKNQTDHNLIKQICVVIQQEDVDHIVLGLPLYLDGKKSDMTKVVLKFKDILAKSFKGQIFLQDEGLTSHEAELRMKDDPRYNFKVDKDHLDALAASIILEDFLNQLIA